MIRQQRRPRTRRRKIYSASFQTISRLSQVALLLKRREFRLKLKRGDRARVQTEMVEFIAMQFPKENLGILPCYVKVAHGRQNEITKKLEAHTELAPLAFCSF